MIGLLMLAAGFSMLVYGLWSWHPPVAWTVGGLLLFVAGASVEDGGDSQ